MHFWRQYITFAGHALWQYPCACMNRTACSSWQKKKAACGSDLRRTAGPEAGLVGGGRTGTGSLGRARWAYKHEHRDSVASQGEKGKARSRKGGAA